MLIFYHLPSSSTSCKVSHPDGREYWGPRRYIFLSIVFKESDFKSIGTNSWGLPDHHFTITYSAWHKSWICFSTAAFYILSHRLTRREDQWAVSTGSAGWGGDRWRPAKHMGIWSLELLPTLFWPEKLTIRPSPDLEYHGESWISIKQERWSQPPFPAWEIAFQRKR